MLNSARRGILYPNTNRSDSADVPRDFAALVAALEIDVIYGQGTLAARPTSTPGSPGIAGRIYMATDQTPHALFYDYGTGWDAVGSLAAGSVGTTQLADGSVTTIKIADVNVTLAKMAADSVNASKIVDGSITATELAATLFPSQGASGATEALRAIGAGAGNVVAGNDSRLTDARVPSTGHDPSTYGTSFPTTGLFNGYRFTLFIANPTSGSSAGDYIYRADIDGTYPWHACSDGVVLTHYVGTSNSLNAQGAFTNLGTVGPQIPLVKAGHWEFVYSMRASSSPSNGNDKAFMAYALSGGTTYGASDADALIIYALIPNIAADSSGTMQKVHGALPAATTVTAQYHQSDTSGFATCVISERKLRARLIKGI